jgi:hypothetical protein
VATAMTLANSGATAGTYTNATVTVDAKGRVTSASSGAGSAPTTAQVLSATAGASVGAVGTYAYAAANTGSNYSEGSTIAGSNLRYFGKITSGVGAGVAYPTNMGWAGGGAPAGTWRCMGRAPGGYSSCYGLYYGNTLWLRIS